MSTITYQSRQTQTLWSIVISVELTELISLSISASTRFQTLNAQITFQNESAQSRLSPKTATATDRRPSHGPRLGVFVIFDSYGNAVLVFCYLQMMRRSPQLALPLCEPGNEASR
jgi:hypothetical protein